MHRQGTRKRSRSRYLSSHNILPTGPHLPEARPPATASVGGGGPRLLRLGHIQRSVAGEASPLSYRRRRGGPLHRDHESHNRLSPNSGRTNLPSSTGRPGQPSWRCVQYTKLKYARAAPFSATSCTGREVCIAPASRKRSALSAATLLSLASGSPGVCWVPLPPAVHRGRSRGT